MAQELGEVEIDEMPETSPIVTVEEPLVDWTTPAPAVEAIPDDLFEKAYKDLDATLVHLQKTMAWPAYQAPWEKQRLKILTEYGMTVEGFYAELTRRNEAKRRQVHLQEDPTVEPS